MHRLRVVLAGACALIAGIASLAFAHTSGAAAQPRSCGEATYASSGVIYRIMFAKNGAVQQYLLAQSSHNTEKDHDVLNDLESKYGPEASNAPPLRITSFRAGSGGMMVPDKAVDSCGRITHFH
jgi:hypothetical protein